MPVINWNKYCKQWPHLRIINFPQSSRRLVIPFDVECPGLPHAPEEVRCGPAEPVPRLTPLGWVCIRNPGSDYKQVEHKHFSRTYIIFELKYTSETEK